LLECILKPLVDCLRHTKRLAPWKLENISVQKNPQTHKETHLTI